jgi:iron complex outermembrane recepter protein
MRKTPTIILRFAVFILAIFVTSSVIAQTKISGKIKDGSTNESLAGVNISVKGKVIGTTTDANGNFSLSTNTPTPFTIAVSFVGYSPEEIVVSGDKVLNISMKEQAIMGQEIVVSASRVEESVMKSPVTVEKMDIRGIKETPSASFYDGLSNIKGIDMTTQGLLFKSVNMRGFGSTGNPRIVQMIDGMDNSAPGLNFAVDNIVGMPELDVESVEILPGAASALYGPNAINGLVLMNSKSPFLYQGLSAAVKTGIMSADNRSVKNTPYYDASVRWAKAWNNKVAVKLNLAYLSAKDWEATNYTNLNGGTGLEDGTRGAGASPSYDGLNVYGDEVIQNISSVASQLVNLKLLKPEQAAAVPSVLVSRTGFKERDLADYNTKSFKFNGALHYRLNEKLELVGQLNYGTGTTMYTGTGRYSLRNFAITQAKVELRGDALTLRAYTTQERSGESFFTGLQAIGMLNEIKPHATWFGEYVGAYLGALGAGASADAAHLAARGFADKGMPTPGTQAFEDLKEKYATKTIAKENGGGSFLDKTNMYHAEGIYNFKNKIKFIELLAGANFRLFQLRSNGTLFADNVEGRNGQIPISEYGAFLQAGKSLFSDHFKLTGSLRYDKNQNFDGQFSPRVSGVYTIGQNNIRLSYQTGFRIPTTQNQYINLQTPGGTLIGGLPEFDTRYNLDRGLTATVLTDFSVDLAKNGANSKYVTNTVKSKALEYATAAVNAQLSTITALVTAGVTSAVNAQLPVITQGVTAAVTQKITEGVTASVNAAVAAGIIEAVNAQAAIQAGVASQLALPATQALIQTNIEATVKSEIAKAVPGQVEATVKSEIGKATAAVIPAFAAGELPKYKRKALTPERISSWEIGYKTLIGKKLFLDAYYYTSRYKNFIGGTTIVVPLAPARAGLPIESGASSGAGFSRPSNSTGIITVSGWAANLNYSLPKGFNIGVNIANNELKGFTKTEEQEYAGFNTPKYRSNITFGKRMGSGEKMGFNLTLRNQSAFVWEAGFNRPTDRSIVPYTESQVPQITNLDAQVSFKLTSFKSILKVGGTNIGSKPYFQAYGSALVGSMYYVSLSFDELFNK